MNCWCGAKSDGSTILGGRAEAYGALHGAKQPTVEDLVACSTNSAKAAKQAARATAAAAERLELNDDQLLGGGSAASEAAWAEDTDSASGLRALVTGRWLETEAATMVKEAGLECSVGQLLNALAEGQDAIDPAEAREFGVPTGGIKRTRKADDVIGPSGSATHTVATKLRLSLIGQLGVEKSCALLRVVTRHGRLHPGIAPKIEGPVVNSEKSENTPPDEWRRLIESDGKAASPFL